MDTYKVLEICSNCGQGQTLVVPKGKRINDYCKTKICSNCGCSIVRPIRNNESMLKALLSEKLSNEKK